MPISVSIAATIVQIVLGVHLCPLSGTYPSGTGRYRYESFESFAIHGPIGPSSRFDASELHSTGA
jgi:hypothetical protein